MRALGRRTSRWRGATRGAALVLTMGLLAACGGGGGDTTGPPTLRWYAAPDRVDADALAATCTEASGGDYRIQVRRLPADVTARHTSLVRRLVAEDDTIDLLSLDSAFTPELAGAGLLAPVPPSRAAAFRRGVAPAALAAATYDGRLAVAPWWFDPQLLWFRGNLAERAGLDIGKPISWDDLIAGADRLGVTIQVEDRDGSGLADWVNALVVGGGGAVVTGTGRDARVGLDSDAGRAAASVVEFYDESGVGPGPSSDAVRDFASPAGGFLLASTAVVSDPALTSLAGDLGWASYPAVGNTGIAPLAGMGLAVPAHAPRPALSYDAISCLTSDTALASLMVNSGHSASRLTTYDDPGVKKAYAIARVARAAVKTGAAAPVTPSWHAVLRAIDETWRPVADVTQDLTPERSQVAVRSAVEGTLR